MTDIEDIKEKMAKAMWLGNPGNHTWPVKETPLSMARTDIKRITEELFVDLLLVHDNYEEVKVKYVKKIQDRFDNEPFRADQIQAAIDTFKELHRDTCHNNQGE